MQDKDLYRIAEPKSIKADRLPGIREVREFTELWLSKSNGKYDVYKAVNGKWILILEDKG